LILVENDKKGTGLCRFQFIAFLWKVATNGPANLSAMTLQRVCIATVAPHFSDIGDAETTQIFSEGTAALIPFLRTESAPS
jgi:hypothetical protein